MPRFVPLAIATSLVAGLALVGLPSGQSSRVHAPAGCAPTKHTVVGTGHTDRRAGTRRNDFMIGSGGNDAYGGGSGKDCLVMGSGNDRGSGGGGADVLLGGSGKDRLKGGAGNDRLVGGRGRDRLFGGSGNDRINAKDGERDTIDCGAGRDVLSADRADRIASNCDNKRPLAPPPTGGGFPDASNTGVPAGTTLTAYSGPSTISTPGTVISGKTIGCVRVSAPGVVIRNSKVSCAGGYAVASFDDDYTGAPLTVQDSEVDCKNTGGNAFGEANIVVRRVDIHGCENGLDINQNVTVEDSYIHDLYNQGSAHTDGAQLASGHYENGHVVPGARNVTFLHNTIYGMGFDGSFGTSAIISNSGGDRDILIQNNLLAGGAVALYCEQDAKGINYRVLDNHFSRKFGPKVGYYGASTECSDETQSGNIHHETGQPLRLP